MIVELLCRYDKEPDDEISKKISLELETQEIIQGDKFDREKEGLILTKKYNSYDYGPFVFNLRDIKGFNYVNAEHICIRFHGDDAFTFKIDHNTFKTVYQSLLGIVINEFTDIKDLKTADNGK